MAALMVNPILCDALPLGLCIGRLLAGLEFGEELRKGDGLDPE